MRRPSLGRAALFVAASILVGCGGASPPRPVEVPLSPPPASPPSPPAAPPRAIAAPPSLGPVFGLRIAQGGRVITPVDHEVTLSRAPFELTVFLRQHQLVLVQVSLKPDILDRARAGQPIDGDDDPFGQGHGMAEAHPPESSLMLDDEASHAFFYDGPDEYRCQEATPVPGVADAVACARAVNELEVRDGAPIVLASQAPPAVYLTAYARGESGSERQRDWLILRFR